MTKNFIVYGLVDPRDGQIRYIGKSSYGMSRPLQHKAPHSLAKDKTYKGHWIRQLLSLGLVYSVVVLRNCTTNEESCQAEKEEIKKAKENGFQLTNLTDGGEGVCGRKVSEKQKEKMRGRNVSESTRVKIRSAKGGLCGEDMGKAVSLYVRGRTSAEVAAIFGVSANAVLSAVRFSGETVRPRLKPFRFTKEQEDDICAKYAAGASAQSISKEYRCSGITVASLLKRRGVILRSASRAHGGKSVVCSNGVVYESQTEAASKLGLSVSSINTCLSGRQKQTGGYSFRFC